MAQIVAPSRPLNFVLQAGDQISFGGAGEVSIAFGRRSLRLTAHQVAQTVGPFRETGMVTVDAAGSLLTFDVIDPGA